MTKPILIQVDMKFGADSALGGPIFQILTNDYVIFCAMNFYQGEGVINGCQQNDDVFVFYSTGGLVGKWYRYGVVIDPNTNLVSFYENDEEIGSFTMQETQQINFHYVQIQVSAKADGYLTKGYFDNFIVTEIGD